MARRHLLWFSSGLFFAAAALLVWLARSPAVPSQTLELKVNDAGEHLRIAWDPKDGSVRKATSGLLEVREPDGVNSYPVERAVLDRGELEYSRRSGDTVLALVLLESGKPLTEGVVRAVGRPEPGAVKTEPVVKKTVAKRSRAVIVAKRKAKVPKTGTRARRRR